MAQNSPVECAKYAKDNGLLDVPGWKRFKKIAKKEKKLIRALNKSKLRHVRRSAMFKFGYQVPRDYPEAVEIDQKNGNTSGKMPGHLNSHR